jgi:mRNA interferase RelE/StbE
MYEVEFTARAEADLANLDVSTTQRLLRRLHWLAENWDATTPEVLAGPWRGVFKLRVGDYRVLYTCDKTQQRITVHFIRHRREVYKAR